MEISPSNPRRRRLLYIDAARGGAALSVAVYHFQIGQGLSHATGLSIFEVISWPGHSIAVPLFFVISGFSVHYAECAKIHQWRNNPSLLFGYMQRRLWRIYPPYLAALIFAVVVGALLGRNISAEDLLSHLTLTHHLIPRFFNSLNVVFWSIGVEVCLYALYPIAQRLMEARGMASASFVILLISTISTTLTAILASPSSVGTWFFPNVFFGWWMGVFLAEAHLQNNSFIRHPPWWTLGVVVLGGYIAGAKGGAFSGFFWPFEVPILVILCAWPLSFLLILENHALNQPEQRGGLTRAFAWLGGISYSLYLVHQPLIDIRHSALQQLPAGFLRNGFFIIWYVIPILVAWIFWRFVEVPSMRAARHKFS